MQFGVDRSVAGLDAAMSALATRIGVEYVSPYHYFCNQDGCLAQVGEGSARSLTAFDTSHLTAEAARMFVAANELLFSGYVASASTERATLARRPA
jgi:SGNH domain (fused to AT3 domains)